MKDAVILMTRVPMPYKTKTRLLNFFTGEECAELHRCFLKDVFVTLQHIKSKADVFLTYTEENEFPFMEDSVPKFVKSFPQEGETLGIKMANAFEKVFSMKYEKVILIGSDIPQLQPMDLQLALEELRHKDVCLGPTLDGGYYLIGMKKLYKEILSDGIKWGNKSVLESTISIANALNLSTALVKKQRDIDVKEDVLDFALRSKNGEFEGKYKPVHTIHFLQRYLEGQNEKRNIK